MVASVAAILRHGIHGGHRTAGATVSYVPEGYTTQAINGTTYYEYGGVDDQWRMMDSGTANIIR